MFDVMVSHNKLYLYWYDLTLFLNDYLLLSGFIIILQQVPSGNRNDY